MGDSGVSQTYETGVGLRIAQVLGLTSTAFFAGKTFSQSFSTTPAFLLAPAPLLARQWNVMFGSDKLLSPVLVLFSSSVFAYLAYKERTPSSTPAILYTTSAALLASCIPYTYLIGEPLNQKLEEKARLLANTSITAADVEVGMKQEETVHFLVDRWALMNLGRTVLSGVAGLLATWAALENIEYGGL